ncbi:hypothetical protein [Pseudochelatococcus contaminans]|uniref:Uncharacterized protein n=1 Tax=Pseudochelatococcus contaminans TaxID=1538103 RepID=A0A7W6EGM3_9HYPH|nr:hypothetical protein [Pseudochelatococcus contaminans]MBB3809569.1 hypothetical protein [Pseudochelatococcus contaminans]
MARLTIPRARTGKTASADAASTRAGRGGSTRRGTGGQGTAGQAREAITGFIRTLERLDAAAPRAGAGPVQTKAATRAPEGE